ncbi:MAG TPA: hypothetical protein VNE40_02580 [Candidatus Dormibacteraeota bacterium]|nr:hypothetical protein [Candidatus Dormibacteraeota bacterium]
MKRAYNTNFYYIVLVIVYFLLAIFLPANWITEKTYHLTASEYHILLVIFMLPVLIFWYAAFYGGHKLKEYAVLVKETAGGTEYWQIARGSLWLAWGIAIPSVLGLAINALVNAHPNFNNWSIILINYLDLGFSIISFSLISNGTKGLREKAHLRISNRRLKALIGILVCLSVLFCFLVFRQFQLNNLFSTANPYKLPLLLVMLSIVIPYLYAWFLGLFAAHEMYLLAKNAHGLFYQNALRQLVGGLGCIISGSIALQYLSSSVPGHNYLLLNGKLLAYFLMLILTAGGFMLIAVSASQLKKLEEI